MKQLVCVTIFILLLYSCNKQEHSDVAVGIIDIDSRNKINFSDLFSEWHLIFPESKDSSFFGLEILRIEKYMDRLYLLNQKQTGKNVLCFNTEGRFLFSIDRYGNGPGEYTYLGDFFIDTKTNNIVVTDEGNEWLYFDMDGSYLYSKKLSSELQFDQYTSEFNDSLYVTYCDCMGEECIHIAFIDRLTLDLKQSIKSTSPFLSDFVPPLSISKDKNTFFYYDGNDTIYDISSNMDTKTSVYFADFGEKQQNFKRKLQKNKEKEVLPLLAKAFKDKEVYYTRSFLYNEKYIVINYFEFDSDNQQQVVSGISFRNQTVFYDRQTKKSYNTTHINFDVFNSVTPKKLTLHGSFDGYFYAVIYDSLSDDEKHTMAKSNFLPEETKNALLNMDDISNPIIMVFK
jgi:hypothetical protein